MRIFLTGATGYIGSALARRLRAGGHEVVALTRDAAKMTRLRERGLHPVVGDLSQPDSWRREAEGCEALIHLGFEFGKRAAEIDRGAVEGMLRSAKSAGAPRLFIYTSGVWVLGDSRDRPLDEEAPLAPPEIVGWRPAIEKTVLAAAGDGLSAAVVRPGCVYGGRGGLYGMMFQSLLTDRKIRLVKNGSNCWASVYLDDLVELYRLVLERRPQRSIYHATNGAAETVRKVAEAFVEAAGGGEVLDWPIEEARRALGPMVDALTLDQRVSSEKAKWELGWQPKMAPAAKCAEALLAQWEAEVSLPSVS
ncbi:MAG TPA: NAD-dependent epimerase [Elusimicrobia bacterium]|nr:MAG: hypothetical protein A2X37_08640 [Elusimicrobia bacterium GWA2_66_18]OGR72975.1 MAG: hypothetical protein A2X40_02510 [Elusimicrobia bacterium GWC2_65_9]HAZ08565.1 NAD-dependent epimerase [Elusimicrobiota bacterium]